MKHASTSNRLLRLAFAGAALVFLATPARAEKPTRFWNLTSATVNELRLAPADTDHFGKNLCAGDEDASVDHDERLKLPGVSSGDYDIRIGFTNGRVCSVKHVSIETGKVFSIEDKDLTACSK